MCIQSLTLQWLQLYVYINSFIAMWIKYLPRSGGFTTVLVQEALRAHNDNI